ncbi:MAG: hypothetical protein Kow0029_21400 [Candidatus Rifleibacteriota bacterium]
MRRLIFVLAILTFLPGMAFGLAVEYMRNGECYLLIGHNDPTFRGVYRLNNPSGEANGNPVGVKLFDPRDSYGISVNLDRRVYTFSENKAPSYVMTTDPIKRKLKAPGDVGLWGAHCDTRKSYYVSTENVTYNQSNRDLYTTTGPMGSNASNLSDDPTNVSWTWSGIVKPTIKKANKWYFQKTSVYCHRNCKYTNGSGDAYWVHFVPVDANGFGTIPNNSWWQSRDPDPKGRRGNLFYWDRVYRKYTYYDLNYWEKSLGIWKPWAPVYGKYAGVADSIYDEIVKRSRISACLNVVCVNGSNEQNFAAKPKFTCLAMSPFGRMYLYTRTQNSTADGQLRLNGSPVPANDPNIRGYLNDLTTEWVGVSTRSTADDFIYLLGTRVIKEWLAAFNIKPSSLKITSVAVSDQWWLDGGIVYAYDADEGAAYQFIRDDKGGKNTCKSIPKKIVIGKDVDALKADGFGNLYYAKTTKTPANENSLSWPDLYTYTGYMFYGGRAYAIAYYRQKVYKTVFCRELGASSEYQVGKIHIGNNIYRRFFSVPLADWYSMNLSNISSYASKPGWSWMTGLQVNSLVSDPKLTQLGVINVATPPVPSKPNGKLGVVDIVGVEDLDPSFKFLTDEVKQGMYTFRIENAPYWEGRNNIAIPGKTKWEGDKNGNGIEGGFVSSVMNTSSVVDSSPEVLYTWRIYKIQDAFGNPLPSPQLVKEIVDTSSSAVKYYFRSGTYQIMASAKFKWYDFDSLPFGSTVADINKAIRPVSGYQTAEAAPVDGGINSKAFPGLKTPFPANTAVTILKVNRQIPIPTGKKVDIQKLAKSVWTDPKVYGTTKYHCVWEDENNKWRLKEDPDDVAKNRSYLYNLYNLPIVNNSNMVPNTLKWKNNMPVQYEWTFNLTMPDGVVYPAQEISKQSWGINDVAINLKQDFPTDPTMGKLVCKAYRDWEYLENTYDSDGNYTGQKKIEGTIEYAGEVDILVKDQTPPRVIAINGKSLDSGPINPVYLGETGGLVKSSMSFNGYSNPASFSILVEDNNIYANMNMVAPVAAADRLHNRGSKQVATFFFERGSGKSIFPKNPADATYKYYSSPGSSIVADITTSWVTNPNYKLMRKPLPYKQGDTSSYVLYVLKVADWKHLQDGTPGDFMSDPARWPIDFANNSPNYNDSGAAGTAHPGYGIFFLPTDSSGNVLKDAMGQPVKTHLGNVWIKDTLLPMVFAETSDFINSFKELQPFGIEKYLVKHPFDNTKDFPWYGKLPNSISDWSVSANGTYPVLTDLLGIPCGLKKKMTTYHPPIIQEGMEIFMQVKAYDNIAVSKTVVPKIKITGPTGLYTEGNPTKIDENSGNRENIRLLLQKSGVYDVTLTAEDNALDFANKPAPNRRTVRFGIVVGPAAMEIRVIDKKNSDF